MRILYVVICCVIFPWQILANESSERVYQQSLHLASQEKLSEAIVALQAASAVLPPENIWRERMLAASVLLGIRKQRTARILVSDDNNYLRLAKAYIQAHPHSESIQLWPVAVLASVFPGAGHAWLDRWHDAGTAAAFVWPFLILTLWAARRKMGPVTVFFGLLTLWLWSGTVFSAVSLAERGDFELYVQWWQGVWQASALQGRPW